MESIFLENLITYLGYNIIQLDSIFSVSIFSNTHQIEKVNENLPSSRGCLGSKELRMGTSWRNWSSYLCTLMY